MCIQPPPRTGVLPTTTSPVRFIGLRLHRMAELRGTARCESLITSLLCFACFVLKSLVILILTLNTIADTHKLSLPRTFARISSGFSGPYQSACPAVYSCPCTPCTSRDGSSTFHANSSCLSRAMGLLAKEVCTLENLLSLRAMEN